MTQETLQQAIALAKSGQKDQARELLQQVLKANPANEMAWLWLTDCLSTREERIQVLETCLRFVPGSQAAQAGLATLRQQSETGIHQPQDITEEPEPAAGSSQPAEEPSQPDEEQPQQEVEPSLQDEEQPQLEEEPSLQEEEQPQLEEDPSLPDEEQLQLEEKPSLQEEEQPAAVADISPMEDETPPADAEAISPETGAFDEAEAAVQTGDAESPQSAAVNISPEVTAETGKPPEAGEQKNEEENEWPQLRDQIQLEPWMQDMADEAGPALGALLGNPDESEGLPGRAKAYDNLPTLPVRKTEPPPAFTVPLEEVSDEEFSEIETRTHSELRNRPIMRPSQTRSEDDQFDPNYLRSEEEQEQEDQPYTGDVNEAGVFVASEDLQIESAGQEPDSNFIDDEIMSENLERTQPASLNVRQRRSAAARRRTRTRQVAFYFFLILIGLIGIAAVLAGLIFFN